MSMRESDICPNIKKNYLEAMERATNCLCKILLQCDAIWIAKRGGFARNLELLLMEALRKGMSQHFAGITPCVANDLDKLIALLQMALGKFYTLMQKHE